MNKTKINKQRNDHQRKTEIISSQRDFEAYCMDVKLQFRQPGVSNVFVQSFTIRLPKIRCKNALCDSANESRINGMQLFQFLRLILIMK